VQLFAGEGGTQCQRRLAHKQVTGAHATPGQRLIYKEIFLFIQKTQTLQLLTHNLFVFFWAKFGKTVGDTDVQLFGAVDNRLSF
jgi:hypothetical protein